VAAVRRYFGTDGVRGEAGKPPLTPEFVLRLGQAAGAYFRQESPRPVVLLAKDTRESSDLLEAALAAGLMSQGVRVEHLGVLPTPGVAHLTRRLGATAGAMISASHNPYQDNGIKFFGPSGEKLPDEAEEAIEALLDEAHPTRGIGTVGDFREAERMYMDFLLEHAPDLTGLKMGLDLAHGATYRVGPKVFQRAGAEVMAFFNTPDGRNINKGCGSTHPEALSRFVVELGLDLGIAFDGDGDRVQFIDRKGRLFHGDHILYLTALAFGEPGVVGTVMSNMGLEVALRRAGPGLPPGPGGGPLRSGNAEGEGPSPRGGALGPRHLPPPPHHGGRAPFRPPHPEGPEAPRGRPLRMVRAASHVPPGPP
jgi:phosphoglucosamine mutase